MNSNNKLIVVTILSLVIFVLMMASVFAVTCWDKDGTTRAECEAYGTGNDCWWDDWGQYCMEKGCWDYWNQSSCDGANATGCFWKTESDMGWNTGWCEEAGSCWSAYTNDACDLLSNCEWRSASCDGPPGCEDLTTSVACQGSYLGCWWDYGNYCYEPGCWDYTNSSSCDGATGCGWHSNSYCTEVGGNCWDYSTSTTCTSGGCSWESYSDGTGYCYQPGCWDHSNEITCNNATGSRCSWSNSSSYCYEKECYNYYSSDECTINVNNVVGGCEWTSSGYCSEPSCPSFNDNQTACNESVGCFWDTVADSCNYDGCWNYNSNSTACDNVLGCEWKEPSCMGSTGCDVYVTSQTCYNSNAGCWWDYGDYCDEISCWDWDSTNQSACESSTDAYNLDCTWDSYWGYCNEKWCGSYTTENACNNSLSGDCYWDNGWCYEESCWGYTANNTCTAAGCDWDSGWGYCQQASATSCYNLNQTECINATFSERCLWENGWGSSGGWCTEKSCYNLYSSEDCTSANLSVECEWSTESGGWCEEEGVGGLNCWDLDNEISCLASANNCSWDSDDYGGGWCFEKGCWDHWSNATCSADANCQWTTSASAGWGSDWGWCEKRSCWNYDNTNANSCVNNSYNLSCAWDNSSGGWCMGPWQNDCWEHDAWNGGNPIACNSDNESGENCTWQAMNGWCYEISKTFSDFTTEGACLKSGWGSWNGTDCVDSELTMQNPGCWIFDGKAIECKGVRGCTYNTTTALCTGLETEGIQCENITSIIVNNVTNQTLCEVIPMLSTCCKWQAGQCATTYDTTCWDQMADPPVGATFCTDYNAIDSPTLCSQIKGEPWYMPCSWNNVTGSCGFKSSMASNIDDIKTKKNCEFIGGTWKTESICGTSNCPYAESWCEIETGSASYGCDMACWGCNTSAACSASKKGYCVWTTDATLPQGGFCDIPLFVENYGDCDEDCGSCEYYGGGEYTPEEACGSSAQGCKWDNTTETCIFKEAKGCGESCSACYDLTDCNVKGLGVQGSCKWDDYEGICKPVSFSGEICFDGEDNDNDGAIDCEDVECTFDSFCGGGDMGTCWNYLSNATCSNNPACSWIQDVWSNNYRCGMKGENCWMYEKDSSACITDPSCNWKNSNFCEINFTLSDNCFRKTTETGCQSLSYCVWQSDAYSSQGGWCDFGLFECNWNETLRQSQSNCESNSFCSWVQDPWSGESWCEPKCFARDSTGNSVYSTAAGCNGAVAGGLCQWGSGWCEPNVTATGAVSGRDCASYDNNMSLCEEQPGCTWFSQVMFDDVGMGSGFFGPSCDVKSELAVNCWEQKNQSDCNYTMRNGVYNNSGDMDACRWVTEGSWSWCEQIGWHCGPAYAPFNMTTGQPQIDAIACNADPYCMVKVDEYMGSQEVCMPSCFNASLNISECQGIQTDLGNTLCVWLGDGAGGAVVGGGGGGYNTGGWCDPAGSYQTFNSMEGGAPFMLGSDVCGNGTADSPLNDWVDICGFGIKETDKDYMFGLSLDSMTYAAVCNGESLWDGSLGSGRKTTKGVWYLDSDGSTTTGCNSDNGAQTGFEFKLVAKWEWSNEGLKEKLVAKKCSNGTTWKAANLRLDTHAKKMCQEMQGLVITVKKADFNLFPALFDHSEPMRIYAISEGENNTDTAPADSVGPGYYTVGTVDFKVEDCEAVGNVDRDADGFYFYEDPDCSYIYLDESDSMKSVEDCTNEIDDDRDGRVDCNDDQCKDEVVCGVSSLITNSSDHKAPKVVDIGSDEGTNSAGVIIKTEERANVTLYFYGTDRTGSLLNATIKAEGMQKTNYSDERERYAFNSVVKINNKSTNLEALDYALDNATTYFYKVKICDISGNCGQSGLKNFTTDGVLDSTTVKITDPDSGQVWQIDDGSGYVNPGSACSTASSSVLGEPINPDIVDEVNIRMPLTNADGESMEVIIEGLETGNDIISDLDLDYGTLTGDQSGDTEDYFKIDEYDWGGNDGIFTEGHPDTLVLKFPGDDSELWDCETLTGSTPGDCTNITGYATRSYNSSGGYTEWTVSNPPVHMWSYIIDQTPSSSSRPVVESAAGGGGSGAGARTEEEVEEEESDESDGEGFVADEGSVGEGAVDDLVEKAGEFTGEIGESFVEFGWLWFILGGVIAMGVVLYFVTKKK